MGVGIQGPLKFTASRLEKFSRDMRGGIGGISVGTLDKNLKRRVVAATSGSLFTMVGKRRTGVG